MDDDECIVLGDSDSEPCAAPAAKRARGAAADADVELVDAQPAPLLADERAEDDSDDDDVRVVGTKGEVRRPQASKNGALLRCAAAAS